MADLSDQRTAGVLAGQNGAGKSTLYHRHLVPLAQRFGVDMGPWLNADEYARQRWGPGHDLVHAYEAAQEIARRRTELIEAGLSFTTETVFHRHRTPPQPRKVTPLECHPPGSVFEPWHLRRADRGLFKPRRGQSRDWYHDPMSLAPEALLEQALSLSHADRARLASGLLASLDDDQADEHQVERLWSEETERRMAQLASGEARTFTRDEVAEGLAKVRAERSV